MRGCFSKIALACAGLCPLAGPGLAQEVGQVQAQWGGALTSWAVVTTARQAGPVYAAEFDPVRLGYEVTVQAVADAARPRQDTISFELLLVQQPGGGHGFQAGDILYLPGGMSGPFWTSRNSPLTVEVLHFDLWGDVGALEAVFDGTLCHRAQMSAPVDRENCQAINGFLTTELRRR